MKSLGINIGAVSVKIVGIDFNDKVIFSEILPHEGHIADVLNKLLEKHNVPKGINTIVTGSEGRFLLNINNVPEITCIEKMLEKEPLHFRAIVSIGGEDMIVYYCSENKKIVNSLSGNKCATGTGEFFKQQLGRMNISLNDIHKLDANSQALKLSKRCTVFMKSDCTHRLNKGQASKDDIVLSLSLVMASKISEYLKKAKVTSGNVLLNGGLVKNKHIIKYLAEHLPNVEFHISPHSLYFEALGAAYLACNSGSPLPSIEDLYNNKVGTFKRYKDWEQSIGEVSYIASNVSQVKKNGTYILGIDGGSTTTKACLVDINTKEIVAFHYGRTFGNPITALTKCLKEIKKQVEQICTIDEINIQLISTTGSSREILGIFCNTAAVYNEILAHSTGTSYYCKDIDTIFEIGGQDAKYVSLHNNVPIDYAMNEACSAGTGSFLEEAAAGDLNITDITLIGPLALSSKEPLKFGEHCSAFINAEIRKAILQGASKSDITAGLILSVVSNYLNRVVGNRTIGNKITIQGGVAKNNAIPLAFAYLTKKNIIVPPFPELLGCFGTALIAIEKNKDVKCENYSINDLINRSFNIDSYFTCKACENYCSIAIIHVDNRKMMFGGRCNKFAINNGANSKPGNNYIETYNDILFNKQYHTATSKNSITVGIPKCFSVYSLYPLFFSFFSNLGVNVFLSDKIEDDGTESVESDYCFPAEIAHGAVLNILKKKPDFIFLPHFKDMKGTKLNKHACLCPITQALPYYILQAFPEIQKEKLLAPEISFKNDSAKTENEFIETGIKMGFNVEASKKAFQTALKHQEEVSNEMASKGKNIINTINKSKPAVAILGRPYNAFTSDANMGIPEKFLSKGVDVLPFDILPTNEDSSYENMYWYYGRQVVEAAQFIKNSANLFAVYITNFSCAPDSFLLHYIRWIMGSKPFLVLELDSHTADAGIDTRIEAFLDIVESFNKNEVVEKNDIWNNGLEFVAKKNEDIYVWNNINKEKIPIRNNPNVKVLLSNMGKYSTDLFAASIKSYGINAIAMPIADEFTVQIAKSITSGKECLPSHLVLGSLLQFINSNAHKKEDIYMLFVPTTTGPCRTGQYFVFYQNIINKLRLENILIFTLDSDNSYQELGKGFSSNGWWALTTADYIKDIEVTLRTCAIDKTLAMKIFEKKWQSIVEKASENIKNILPALKKMAIELSTIPLKSSPGELKKVLIVGEIYVRRDDFAVNELIENLSNKGIICKISGITEWIFYCDFIRKNDIDRNIFESKSMFKIFTPEYSEKLKWHIEKLYKHRVEEKIKKALSPSGLLIEFPNDMQNIMSNCKKYFIEKELYSEISISSGVASTALMNGYAGVINISPFACLIGRVIEGIIKPWARENNYPVISVEIDGNALPINTINKIDIFTANVLRAKK